MWGCGRGPHSHLYTSQLLDRSFFNAPVYSLDKTLKIVTGFPDNGKITSPQTLQQRGTAPNQPRLGAIISVMILYETTVMIYKVQEFSN